MHNERGEECNTTTRVIKFTHASRVAGMNHEISMYRIEIYYIQDSRATEACIILSSPPSHFGCQLERSEKRYAKFTK